VTCAVPFSILLGTLIVLVETRRRRLDQIDFLLPVSALTFVCFVLIPIVLPFYRNDSLGEWGWLFERGIDGWTNAGSVVLAAVLYAIVALVYLKPPKRLTRALTPYAGSISTPRLAAVGLVLLAIAIAATALFVDQRGGVVTAVTEAVVFKTAEDPLGELVFAIKLGPFATVASFVFLHLYGESRGPARFWFGCLFLVAAAAALFVLFLLGGRVVFIFYVLTFLLGEFIYRGKRLRFGAASVAFVALVLPVILFGKGAIRVFSEDFVLEALVGDFVEAPSSVLRLFVLEFSFPWVNLANLMVLTPEPIAFRWFVDVPLGFAYLLPKLLLGIQLPPTIHQVYDAVIDAPVPVDLASFGYVSAGVGGVMIVAVAYGLVLRIAEETLSDRGSRIWCLVRAAWILQLGEQVMYGSPDHFFPVAFTLLVSTGLLLLVSSRTATPKRLRADAPPSIRPRTLGTPNSASVD